MDDTWRRYQSFSMAGMNVYAPPGAFDAGEIRRRFHAFHRCLRLWPGKRMDVIVIGAGYGVFVLAAGGPADKVRYIHAIEPNREKLAFLIKSVELNVISTCVVPYQLAIGPAEGRVRHDRVDDPAHFRAGESTTFCAWGGQEQVRRLSLQRFLDENSLMSEDIGAVVVDVPNWREVVSGVGPTKAVWCVRDPDAEDGYAVMSSMTV